MSYLDCPRRVFLCVLKICMTILELKYFFFVVEELLSSSKPCCLSILISVLTIAKMTRMASMFLTLCVMMPMTVSAHYRLLSQTDLPTVTQLS